MDNDFKQIIVACASVVIITVLAALVIYASETSTAQPSTIDLQRKAFLAGASAGWHPGLQRWVFTKTDPTDPDWEEAFQVWLATEKLQP